MSANPHNMFMRKVLLSPHTFGDGRTKGGLEISQLVNNGAQISFTWPSLLGVLSDPSGLMGGKTSTSCQAVTPLLSRIRQSVFVSYVYCKKLALQALFDLTCISQNQKPRWWWQLCSFWKLLKRFCSVCVLTSQGCSQSLACGHVSLALTFPWFWRLRVLWLYQGHRIIHCCFPIPRA